MASARNTFDIATVREQTNRAQGIADDPAASVLFSANAVTGKKQVLAQLRILPQRR